LDEGAFEKASTQETRTEEDRQKIVIGAEQEPCIARRLYPSLLTTSEIV
jgi:hypothetical protein